MVWVTQHFQVLYEVDTVALSNIPMLHMIDNGCVPQFDRDHGTTKKARVNFLFLKVLSDSLRIIEFYVDKKYSRCGIGSTIDQEYLYCNL
jgi:hypothetical protein